MSLHGDLQSTLMNTKSGCIQDIDMSAEDARFPNHFNISSSQSHMLWDQGTHDDMSFAQAPPLLDADLRHPEIPSIDNAWPAGFDDLQYSYDAPRIATNLDLSWAMHPSTESSNSGTLGRYEMHSAADVPRLLQATNSLDSSATDAGGASSVQAPSGRREGPRMETIYYRDMDGVCRFIANRLRILTSDPCHHVLARLIDGLEPHRRNKWNYQKNNRPHKGPPWWNAMPWPISWHPGPLRLNMSDASFSAAYILMMPHYAPSKAQKLLDDSNVNSLEVANSSSPWTSLLEYVLIVTGDLPELLKTNYSRKKNEHTAEADRVPGKGNTTKEEIDARTGVIKSLFAIAYDVEQISNGGRDRDSIKHVRKPPPCIREHPYNASKTREPKRKDRAPSLDIQVQSSTDTVDDRPAKRRRPASPARKVVGRRKRASHARSKRCLRKSDGSPTPSILAPEERKRRMSRSSSILQQEGKGHRKYLIVPAPGSDTEQYGDDDLTVADEDDQQKLQGSFNTVKKRESEDAYESMVPHQSFSDMSMTSEFVQNTDTDHDVRFVPEAIYRERPVIPSFADESTPMVAPGYMPAPKEGSINPIDHDALQGDVQHYPNSFLRDTPISPEAFNTDTNAEANAGRCGFQRTEQLDLSLRPDHQWFVSVPSHQNNGGPGGHHYFMVNGRDVSQYMLVCQCGHLLPGAEASLRHNFSAPNDER